MKYFMKNLFLASIASSILTATMFGQNCPVEPGAPPFKQEVSGQDHFEWYRAYAPDPSAGNGNVFDRHVRNLGNKLLKYQWSVGRMYNFGLPPGQTDSLCVGYGRPNSKRGPLYHGRENEQNDTSVWEGEGEPTRNTIVGRFSFFFSDTGGDPEVSIIVKSSFDGKSYKYSLKNMSKTPVRVSWSAIKEIDLFEELGKGTLFPTPPFPNRQRTESTLIEQLKKGKILEPGQEVIPKIIFGNEPTILSTHVDVGSIDGHPLAGAALPILIPSR